MAGALPVQQLSIVQDYILKAILNHRVVKPLGSSGTVWAGVDFTRDVGVLSDVHDVVHDLYAALEDWLLITVQDGGLVPIVDDIDLNGADGRSLVEWHQSHRPEIDTEQAWFWTPEWQAGEREASQQLQRDNGEVFENGKNLLAAFEEEDETG
jgi:hypothetical protein